METSQHSAVLDLIGSKRVRHSLGISSRVLWNWRERGVPATQRLPVARLLIAEGHDLAQLPADFLDAETVQGLRLSAAVRAVAIEGEAA